MDRSVRSYVVSGMLLSMLLGAQNTLAQDSSDTAASKASIHEAELLKRYPPPGRMIDVGGRRLHMLCKGPERGPVVVIEGGAFAASYGYWKAQDAVAETAHVCTYDRAGLGWSDPAPLPRALQDRIGDLHTLLHKSGLKGPFILLGHSMGGMLVRVYAHQYPNDVYALILVEPSNERVNTSESARARSEKTAAQIAMAFPVLAAGGEIPQVRIPGGPPEQDILQRESQFRAGQDDMLLMAHLDTELQKIGDLGTLGNKPLVIITRGKPDPGMGEEIEKQWRESHQWLATLSTRSVLLVADNSGHMVNFDRPDLFRVAVSRVLEMK